jgi:hypothetical protein
MKVILSSVIWTPLSSKDAKYTVNVIVGVEHLSFEVLVQHIQLAGLEVVTVHIPEAFELKVNLNGPICQRLHEIIREWHNGNTLPLPVLLGDTDKSIYPYIRR